MQLKLETTSVQMVNDSDLIDFLTEAYGLKKPYELVAIEELSNDSYTLFNVELEPLTDSEKRDIETLKSTNFCGWITSTLLKDLCNRGWIAPGRYLVAVSC